MAVKNNAICAVCGKEYYVCVSCKDFMNLQPWKLHTDTSEHYKIYQIIHGYSTGVFNEEDAKQRLNNVDLSDLDSLRENIKNTINKIINNDNLIVEKKEKITRKKKSVKTTDAV